MKQDEDDKHYPQIYMEEGKNEEKKAKEKIRHAKGKIVILDTDVGNEKDDKSME